jgi:hypothetical protein
MAAKTGFHFWLSRLGKETPMRSLIAALALSAGGIMAASPALAVKDDCVFIRSIDGYNVIDDHTLIIHDGQQAYRVNLFGPCTGLRWTEDIAIDSRDGMMCWPSNNHIIISDHGIKQTCMVDSVVKMAPADIEKLKADKKKKDDEKKDE